MRASFKKLITTSSVLLAISFTSQADIVDQVEKSFEFEGKSSLRVNNINGSVEIKAWDNTRITVTATITADDQEDRDNIIVDMEQSGAGLNVETRYKEKSRWGKNNNSGQVEYVINVPANTDLSAIELVNGSLLITGVKGEVSAELVNGSINASGLADNGEFTSVNGSVKVSYDTLVQSMSRIDIETVNGSIKLYVPQSVNADVNAETMHGSIKTDFGLHAEKNFLSGHNLSGNIGNGDINISLESVNGSVKLLAND